MIFIIAKLEEIKFNIFERGLLFALMPALALSTQCDLAFEKAIADNDTQVFRSCCMIHIAVFWTKTLLFALTDLQSSLYKLAYT